MRNKIWLWFLLSFSNKSYISWGVNFNQARREFFSSLISNRPLLKKSLIIIVFHRREFKTLLLIIISPRAHFTWYFFLFIFFIFFIPIFFPCYTHQIFSGACLINLASCVKHLISGLLGQNGPFLKLNVESGLISKLLFKMALWSHISP